ncbi:DUF6882 domain-containing protein [Pseudomonas sp. MPB26]|uniref:DUF6882 domain-containing protein n=1 Tax=Pseudomonas sp. MPB26 TaxID=3388491 RepID=UPI0039856427
MTDHEFEAFLAQVMDELSLKQTELGRTYGLGEMARWWFEQATGVVQFFDDNDRLAVVAEVLSVGSFSAKFNTWKWAWSNPSVEPALREAALPLKQLQAITGREIFGSDEAFAVHDEGMAWELTAAAVHHLQAQGCYRAPSGPLGPTTFLAIRAIRTVQ